MAFWQHFGRITSGRKVIPEIEGLRFVAIMPVVLLHTNTHFKRVFADHLPAGYLESLFNITVDKFGVGVMLFFSISGFILGMPFFRHARLGGKPVGTKPYLIRRLTRLEPPFVVAMVAIYAASLVMGLYGFSDSFPNFMASIFYVHVFVYGAWSIVNGVTWSLETEVQFYLSAPLLARVYRLPSRFVRYAVYLIGYAAAVWVQAQEPILLQYHLHLSILKFLHCFMVGMVMCDLYMTFNEWFSRRSYFYDVLALAIPFGWFWAVNPARSLAYYDGVVVLLFIVVFKSKLVRGFLAHPIPATIGTMCYSIYLLHYAWAFLLFSFSKHLMLPNPYANLVFQQTLSVTTALTVSAVFFRLFERPCMDRDWPRKLYDNLRGRVAPVLSRRTG